MKGTTCQWPECGTVLVNGERRGRPRRWCDEHLRARQNDRPKDSPTRTCVIDGCGRAVRAHDLCVTHYNAEYHHGSQRLYPGDLAKRAAALRAKSRFRKAIVTAPDAEAIDLTVLGDRDGWLCGICHKPVDKELRVPDRAAPTIDHVLPISRGGRHRWNNVQLSHFACNMAKGDALAA